jgi:DNA-binding transcriptional LysR family regulator
MGFEYPDAGEYRHLPMAGPVVVNNSDAYNAACLAGLGLIQAPLLGVREHLTRGELVEVLPRYRPEPMSMSLLYAHRRNLPKRVRTFMDWVSGILHPVLAH